MKHIYLILTGIIVLSLIACGKNSPNKNGGYTPGSGSVVNPGLGGGNTGGGTTNPGGTIDGGGGNSLQDKMLESYIVKPQDLAGFELVAPLLKNLKKILNYETPNSDEIDPSYYGLIEHALNKSWYLIPVDLKTLTNDKLGAPFVSGTTQVAFQDLDAVWIDENAFNKMPLDEKAKLILHEIVMSLKLFKFESDDTTILVFEGVKRKLDKDLQVQPTRLPINISAEDVSQVRTVTRKLWEYQDSTQVVNGAIDNEFSRYEFATLMLNHNFDRIVYKAPEFQIGMFELGSGYRMTKNIDDWINGLNHNGKFLYAGYHSYTSNPKVVNGKKILEAVYSCKADFKKINDKEMEVSFHLDKSGSYASADGTFKTQIDGKYKVNIPEKILYSFDVDVGFEDKVQIINLYGAGSRPEMRRKVTLSFDGHDLIGVETSDVVVTAFVNEDGYTMTKGTQIGSELDAFMNCFNKSKLEMPADEDQ